MSETTREAPPKRADEGGPVASLGLVLLWSREEPDRVGEVARVPPGTSTLGRGTAEGARCLFAREVPGRVAVGRPLASSTVSRVQLELRAEGEELAIRSVGRRPLRHRGWPVERCDAEPGDLLEVEDELLFGVELRPSLDALEPLEAPRLGAPDVFGIVGESPAVWELRRALRFVARRDGHVLLLGPSGAGKELAARAVHQLSRRRGRPFVARNAAAFPESLVEAELFGHAANYPQAGMPARPGVFAEADTGTLFLDELGELPQALQARLLRVLDQGELHRLGERGSQRVDVRVVGATNRPAEALKHDLRPRFPHVVTVPGLAERRADIPLLVRHLVREIGRKDPEAVQRFVDAEGCPRVTLRWIAALLQQEFPGNVRDLLAAIWASLRASTGDTLAETPEVTFQPGPTAAAVAPEDIPRDVLEAALARHDGVREKVWRDLGLSSRHQLLRLLRKHGL